MATLEFTPRHIVQLLVPALLSVRNRHRQAGKGDWLRFLLFGSVTLVFALGIFGGFYWVLLYLGRFPEFTAPLTQQMLGTVSMFILTVLLASNVITALSTQHLSEDLSLLAASPVPFPALYGSRLILTLAQSSWMILIFSLPIYAAFAVTSQSPCWFGLGVALVLPALVVIPAAMGSMMTSFLMALFPARRLREMLMLVGAFFVGLLILLIRTQQPERLLNPRSIYDVAEFFAAFRTPSLPLLPSTWANEVLAAGRQAQAFPGWPLLLLYSSAAAMVVLGCWTARGVYWRGYSRAQESRPARLSRLAAVDRVLEATTRPFELRFRCLLLKDIRSFLRDATQWSQLLLLLALVVIYLYNFSVLPANFTFATFYLQNVFSFLNLGLAGFVLSAVAVRFVFTSVSAEGQAFWIIRSSPLSLGRFLWSKFWSSIPPLLVLSQILILASNYFLGATPFMTVLASLSMLGVTFGVVGMGVGMGAAFPRFKFENVTQIAGSSGGLLYMIAASSFIAAVMFLQAVPVYFYLSSIYRGSPVASRALFISIAALAAAVVLNVLAVLLPMRWGRRRLATIEI
ncbi:MAG: hypothetical protein ACE5JI_12240 [Acidobacteriota bacterium]